MPRKRGNGQGGIYYIKSRKLWRGVIDDGFKPDGTRRQRMVHARTQAAVGLKLQALRDELKTYGAPIDKQTKVSDWAEHWLATVCRPQMKPNGLKSYESVTRNWIIPAIGSRPVALVKPSDVRLVQKRISEHGRSSSTALKAYNILSGMLEAARVEGLCARNVAKDVSAPTAALSTVGALTTDAALAVLATSLDEPDGSRWWAGILDGLRQGERLGARLEDLDLDRGRMTVRWSLTEISSEHGCGGTCGMKRAAACPNAKLKVPDGFEYRRLSGRLCLVPPKSGRARPIPIPGPLVEMLRTYIAATAHVPNPHGLIWRNPDGSPIIGKQDEQDWRNLLNRAGLISLEQTKAPTTRAEGTPDVPGSHTMRHTTATVLMELGVDAKIIGEIVGHAAERTTRGYQHVTTSAAAEAMDRLSDHFTSRLEIQRSLVEHVAEDQP